MNDHAVLVSSFEQLPVAVHTVKPGVHHVTIPTLSINDVRTLRATVFARPLGKDSSLAIVIVTEMIRTEAQNALLKLFEDPPPDVTFYVVLSDQTKLLPTLVSRFTSRTEARGSATSGEATMFLRQSYAERLETIAEKVMQKDTTWMQTLTQDCMKLSRQERWSLTSALAVLFVSQRLGQPGASAKMLLEHLALTAPRLK